MARKQIIYGGLWTKMQIQYIERRFGRKLKREEIELLVDYFNKKDETNTIKN